MTTRKPQDLTLGMLNVTQHWFDNDMDQWGKTRGDEVFEGAHRMSRLLGPDGAPLVYNNRDTYLPDLLICRREWAERVLDAVAAIEA